MLLFKDSQDCLHCLQFYIKYTQESWSYLRNRSWSNNGLWVSVITRCPSSHHPISWPVPSTKYFSIIDWKEWGGANRAKRFSNSNSQVIRCWNTRQTLITRTLTNTWNYTEKQAVKATLTYCHPFYRMWQTCKQTKQIQNSIIATLIWGIHPFIVSTDRYPALTSTISTT